ncbi:hypothetical protein Cs7R123_20770 [Catellatospora sp. TT07R-123]|nr:hypothetical protein Cs7R123_20770 [Catellatospora sp. TT07R-123]
MAQVTKPASTDGRQRDQTDAAGGGPAGTGPAGAGAVCATSGETGETAMTISDMRRG